MVEERLKHIEIRHLEALRAVVEEGTFTDAGIRLGYSQAAVSQQVAALEAALGESVFDRPGGPRPVVLTPAGRLALRHAQVVTDRIDQLRADIDALKAGMGGRLACGTFQSVSVELLPTIVGRILTETPDLQVRVDEADENEPLIASLIAGDLDVAFLAGPVQEPDIEVIPLGADPFVAVLANDEYSAELTSYDPMLLNGIGVIGENGGGAQLLIENGLRALGVSVQYVFRTNDNGAMQAMARNGLAPAIMPLLAVDAHDPNVRVLPLNPPIPPRQILIALPRPALRTAAATRFAQIAVEVGQSRLNAGGAIPV
ncbi:MAG: LysR family transcriptional regulator [Candidatus Nanopelagicales bacterium]|nr:LysR family transcriptional regulator [Candidatus Nanopelagicales bacterium]MDP4825304.1 LysR family transcriptional regulator [Candidatus Nanopelagicales bacterium]